MMSRVLAWLRPLPWLTLVGASLAASACFSPAPGPAEHPVTEYPELAGKRTVYREELDPPIPAPSSRLIDYNGETLALYDDLAGKVVVLSFVYTRCPDVCPLLISQYLTMQRTLGDLVDDRVYLVLVTTDPEWDTPGRLAAFTRNLGGRWHFLSGERAQLEEVWRQYEVYVTVNPQDIVQHSYKVFIIDGDGMMRYRYGGLFSVEEAVADIRGLLGLSQAVRRVP